MKLQRMALLAISNDCVAEPVTSETKEDMAISNDYWVAEPVTSKTGENLYLFRLLVVPNWTLAENRIHFFTSNFIFWPTVWVRWGKLCGINFIFSISIHKRKYHPSDHSRVQNTQHITVIHMLTFVEIWKLLSRSYIIATVTWRSEMSSKLKWNLM